MRNETQVEIPRRIAAFVLRRGLDSEVATQLATLCLDTVECNVVVLEEAVYGALEEEARARATRDPRDWLVVACALALTAGIWTRDHDFLGAGVPTWTTETLQGWLDRHPAS